MELERIQRQVEKSAQLSAARLHKQNPHERVTQETLDSQVFTLFSVEPELKGLSQKAEKELKELYQESFQNSWKQLIKAPRLRP